MYAIEAPNDFIHIDDIRSLEKLLSNKDFHRLKKTIDSIDIDQYLVDKLKLRQYIKSEEKLPYLNTTIKSYSKRLEISTPDLYIDTLDTLRFCAFGKQRSGIIIGDEMLRLLDENQLRAMIAHECGHLFCGHIPYFCIAVLFQDYSNELAGIKHFSPGFLKDYQAWVHGADKSADRVACYLLKDSNHLVEGLNRLYFSGFYEEPCCTNREKSSRNKATMIHRFNYVDDHILRINEIKKGQT